MFDAGSSKLYPVRSLLPHQLKNQQKLIFNHKNLPGTKAMHRIARSEPTDAGCLKFSGAALLLFSLLFMVSPVVYAQQEDTTRTERRFHDRPETTRHNMILRTPFQMDILPDGTSRYRLNDAGTMHGFYRRLQYMDAGDFLLGDDGLYEPYGPEWERELNEALHTLLSLTFKEENTILRTLARLAPFLGFGFFERYELPPPPRIEHPDKVPDEQPPGNSY